MVEPGFGRTPPMGVPLRGHVKMKQDAVAITQEKRLEKGQQPSRRSRLLAYQVGERSRKRRLVVVVRDGLRILTRIGSLTAIGIFWHALLVSVVGRTRLVVLVVLVIAVIVGVTMAVAVRMVVMTQEWKQVNVGLPGRAQWLGSLLGVVGSLIVRVGERQPRHRELESDQKQTNAATHHKFLIEPLWLSA